jgi:SAM-dependent methyltransferase
LDLNNGKELTMNERETFYLNCVCDIIKDKNSSILVCGGGPLDKNIFEKLGFHDVTISNIDSRMKEHDYDPFKWKYENAESLSFNAELFDFVVIHATIHHASSPHKVLTEMYRVARKGILAFESRDSVIIRLFEKFGFTQTYEHAAVFYSDCKYGGMNNTEIPNYIYRWTEREIEKTIQSYAPYFKHKFVYNYGTAFPCTPELENNAKLKVTLLKSMRLFFYVFVKLFPKQQNLFSFYVEKPIILNSLFPWLIFDDKSGKITFNKEWGNQKYKSPIKSCT